MWKARVIAPPALQYIAWARLARGQIAKASPDFAKHERLEAAWETER